MIGLIVGAAPIKNEKSELLEYLNNPKVIKIAADGGINSYIEAGVMPDLFMGDMDSSTYSIDAVRSYFPDINIETCSPIKDASDMEMAIDILFNKGCTEVIAFGGIGGDRFEHNIANIQVANGYARNKKKITFVGDNSRLYVITSGDSISFNQEKTGKISVFSLDGIAKNVKIEGLCLLMLTANRKNAKIRPQTESGFKGHFRRSG